jgi:hypothetical protein
MRIGCEYLFETELYEQMRQRLHAQRSAAEESQSRTEREKPRAIVAAC